MTLSFAVGDRDHAAPPRHLDDAGDLPLATARRPRGRRRSPSPATIGERDLVFLVLLGVGQMGLGLVLFTMGARLIVASEVALITLLEVVLGPFWAWVAVGETPALMTVVGGVVVRRRRAPADDGEDAPPASAGGQRRERPPRSRPARAASPASRSFWYGIGCEAAPTRMTGASRSQKQCSATCAAISEPKPQNWTASCATTSRCVFATDAAIRAVSSGTSVRGSTTSTLTPSASSSCAARSACGHERAERDDGDVRSLARDPRRRRARSRSAPPAPARARRRRGASARGR